MKEDALSNKGGQRPPKNKLPGLLCRFGGNLGRAVLLRLVKPKSKSLLDTDALEAGDAQWIDHITLYIAT